MAGRRLVVVGTTGSGKSTVGRRLAERLGVASVELDALHWEPGWTEAEPEVFRARVAAATAGDGWVVAGNYHTVRDLTWGRAETIVWLDYPHALVAWRLLRRTVLRVARREELWNGNRESFRRAFASRDSILVWFLRSARRRRREYAEAMRRGGEYPHLRWVRLPSPRATERWLAAVVPSTADERRPPVG